MLPVITLVLGIPLISWAAYVLAYNDKKDAAIGWGAVGALIIVFAWGCILWGSYNSYLDSRAFFSATKEQYRSALTVYKDHATIDVKAASLTDFKYQGYQEQIGHFVKTLRSKVTDYNETIVKKRVMKDNILFKWMIIAPDSDMVPINLLED
jgi:hypothetical protein